MIDRKEKNIVIKEKGADGSWTYRLIPEADFLDMGTKTIIRAHTQEGIERISPKGQYVILHYADTVAQFEESFILNLRARIRIALADIDGGISRPFTTKINGGTIRRDG